MDTQACPADVESGRWHPGNRRTLPPDGADAESAIARHMCGDATRTFRLAVALFSERLPLVGVLSDLASRGCPADCLCLIGHPETLGPEMRAGELAPEIAGFRRLFDEVVRVERMFRSLTCVASAGPLLDDLSRQALDGCHYPSWLSETQYRRLERHILTGGLVLIVSSGTPDEHDAFCRALLRHSRHGVQSHDFTLRTATATSAPAAATKGGDT